MEFQSDDKGEYGPWTSPTVIDESIPDGFKETHRLIVDRIMDECAVIQEPSSKMILEVGAGLGALGEIIPPRYVDRYVQTDRTPLYVEHSSARNPHLKSQEADVYDLPFPDASASLVVARDLFDMLDQPEVAAASIYDVLTPGGQFIHLHDRRPNVGHVVRNLRLAAEGAFDDVIMLPAIRDETLTHLKLVTSDVYLAAREQWRETTRKTMDYYVNNTENLDLLRSSAPGQVDAVAKLAARLPGVETATFGEAFSVLTAATLQKTGFSEVTSRTVTAESEVSDEHLDYLFPAAALAAFRQQPPAMRDNILVHYPSGKHELRGIDPQVPTGKIRQIGMLSVIIAQKAA